MIDMRDVLRDGNDLRRALRGDSIQLGQATVTGILTEVERNQILDLIDQANAKATAVNDWVSANGAALATMLGNWAGTWNTAWNKATLYAPTISQISLDLSSGDATLWAWDPTKESALQGWMAAINQLYEIMQKVITAPLPTPTPTPTPSPTPTPTPASYAFPLWGYIAIGLGVLGIGGGIAYAAS